MNRRLYNNSLAVVGLLVWSTLTALSLGTTLVIYRVSGKAGLDQVLQAEPGANLTLNILAVAATWVLVGLLLALLTARWINATNGLEVAGFFIVSLLYINILRERVVYGDLEDYVRAAFNLAAGEHLHPRYLYPPFLATLLTLFIPLGNNAIFYVCWLANIIAVPVLFLLLSRCLQLYGYPAPLAVLVTVIFMSVNMPILRTLVYGQVNLHVLNLILGCLLLYRRAPFLSALALALAVHVKLTPIVLVLAFIIQKDWRWLFWFSLALLTITAYTIASYGVAPYRDFLTNSSQAYAVSGVAFRNYSWDSLVFSTGYLANHYGRTAHLIVYLGKAIFAITTLLIMGLNVQQKTFYKAAAKGVDVYNSVISLFLLMILLSPVTWEHSSIFLALPMLLILKKIQLELEWLIYGAAYYFLFLMPTIDFYPWSYLRFFSVLICLGCLWWQAKRDDRSSLFEASNRWLSALAAPLSQGDENRRTVE